MKLRMILAFALWGGACQMACQSYHKEPVPRGLASQIAKEAGSQPSVRDYFRFPQYKSIGLSPDGRYFSAIYPNEKGTDVLAIMNNDLKTVVSILSFDRDRHVVGYAWLNHERLAVTVGKSYGYLDGRYAEQMMYMLDYDGGRFRDFFSKEAASYSILAIMPQDPDHILMMRRNASLRPTPVKVNIYSGAHKYYSAPVDHGYVVAEEDGDIYLARSQDPNSWQDKGAVYVRSSLQEPWRRLSYQADKVGLLQPLHFDAGQKIIYLISARETGRSGLYAYNLTTNKLQLLFEDPVVDMSKVLRFENQFLAVMTMNGKPKMHYLLASHAISKLHQELSAIFSDGFVDIQSWTDDKMQFIFTVTSDRSPEVFYHFDRRTRQARYLASAKPWIDKKKTVDMRPISFLARDGLQIFGYLTTPRGVKPDEGYPLIVLVHGGPHGPRDSWGWDPEVQFFASRGFAVLQVNYRGSGGYGRQFMELGYRHWGLAMQDDLSDATHWAIERGIADRRRICIYGASYGGYAAMMGVIREPHLYRCAVTYAGISDLTLMYQRGDTKDSPLGRAYLGVIHGRDESSLKRRSPRFNVEKIKVPVFIIHGGMDQRVNADHALLLRRVMQELGKEPRWLFKQDEGHGFRQEANRFQLYLEMIDFLKDALAKRDFSNKLAE